MPSIDLGRITPIPKGAWSSSSTYERLDIVNNMGNSYIAKQDVPINTSITTEQYWQPLIENNDYVTPEMFGAKGDGITDDTNALITMFSKNNKDYVLNGTYAISEPINAHGRIFGNGKIIVKDTVRISSLFNVNGNIYVEGITFDCSCDTTFESTDYGTSYNVAIFSESNAYDIIVDHANFINGYTIFISCHLTSGKFSVTNSHFSATGTLNKWTGYMIYLLSISGTDKINIQNNTFIGNGDSAENFAGIFMSGITTRSVIDIGNNLFVGVGRDKTGGHQSHCIDCYWNVSHLFAHDNVMLNNSYCCLRIHGGTDFVVQNNVFGEAATQISDSCVLVSDDKASTGATQIGVSDVRIVNNVFKSTTRYQGAIQLTSTNSDGAGVIDKISVDGNMIDGSYIYPIMIDGSVKNFTISNNDITAGTSCIYLVSGGVTFQSNRPITVAENRLKSVGGSVINSQASVGNPLMCIANNFIDGYTGGITMAETSTYVSALNNTVNVSRNGESYGIKNVSKVGCNLIEMVDSTSPISGATTNFGNYINGTLQNNI